jgi:hypothetical protein
LTWIGRIAGAAGSLLFVVAMVARLLGHWRIGDMATGTVLQAATSVMVLAALAYAAATAERRSP